jgi:hypothetical protein
VTWPRRAAASGTPVKSVNSVFECALAHTFAWPGASVWHQHTLLRLPLRVAKAREGNHGVCHPRHAKLTVGGCRVSRETCMACGHGCPTAWLLSQWQGSKLELHALWSMTVDVWIKLANLVVVCGATYKLLGLSFSLDLPRQARSSSSVSQPPAPVRSSTRGAQTGDPTSHDK